MKAFLKNPKKMAGLLLLLVWMTFSVYNLSYSLPKWKELAQDLADETDLIGVVQDVDEFVQEKVVLRQPMVEAYSLMQMALGKREVNNLDRVKDRLGYLHGGNFYVGFGDDQRKIAINFRLLMDYAAQCGTQTGVVITPMKVAPEDARYAGLPYNSFYPEAETLLAWLRHYNVSCLDLRDLPEWSGLGYEGSFYKTDRHWTTPAAFAGYCRILDWLEQTQGLVLDPGGITRNPDNYTVQNYLLTLDVMKHFGIEVRREGLTDFYVPKGIYVSPGDYTVESDASSASYPLAAAAITGGKVRVLGVGAQCRQGDIAFTKVLEAMGAKITMGPDWVECEGAPLKGVDMNLNDIPDAAMTVAPLALFAKGKTRISGIASWKVKETDRITAIATELRKVGAEVVAGDDFIEITPPAKPVENASIATYNDHRMAMCFSLVALGGVPITILDPACVNKTYPKYFEDFLRLSK